MVTPIGLPLLIVNGKFQSLGSMTVEDLETFIPFLVKCSVTRAGAQLINGVPEWWSSTIQYKFPLQKPNGLSQIGYRRHLSSIVCRCYWYHDVQYLLPFCAEIANSPESIFLRNNEDNTTSIFYVHNTNHVMKFNNENKDYDMRPKKDKTFRRCLLSTLPKKTTTILDIYLCENCDAEFSSHSDMQKHEKQCYEVVIDDDDDNVDYNNVNNKSSVSRGGGGSSNCGSSREKNRRTDSSEEIEIIQHIKPIRDVTTKKTSFLNYLSLQPKNNSNLQRTSKLRKKNSVESHSKRWVNADLCLHKNRNVEFSSIYARKMLEHSVKRDIMTQIERSIMLNELYCSPSVRTNRDLREPVEFKVTCKKPKKGSWVHQYCFNKRERQSRYKTLKTGLDEKSRRLLKQCKGLRIVLNRLKLTT